MTRKGQGLQRVAFGTQHRQSGRADGRVGGVPDPGVSRAVLLEKPPALLSDFGVSKNWGPVLGPLYEESCYFGVCVRAL